MRRIVVAVVLLCAVPVPVSALACWSSAKYLPAGGRAVHVAVAVDGRGDAAVAWGTQPPLPLQGSTTVRVAVRRGLAGVWSMRLLRSTPDFALGDITLAMAPSGEVTVAWIDESNVGGALAGARTVRAAYRASGGRWSTVQAVGLTSPFYTASPRVAAARDGTVALVYNAGVRAAPGMAAVWRRPGERFGHVTAVPGPRLPPGSPNESHRLVGERGYLSQPTLAFDPSGTAFLAGTTCFNLSHGALLTALAPTHRFGAPRTIAPFPATEVRFVLTGPGRGLASWLDAACSTTEIPGGSTSARAIGPARSGPIVTVDSSGNDNDLALVAGPSGADLNWLGYPDGFPTGAEFVAHVGFDGTTDAPRIAAAADWVPAAADGSGDQVLQTALAVNENTIRSSAPVNVGQPPRISARAAGATTVDPSPLGLGSVTAAGSTTGSSLIAAVTLGPTLRVATWTP